MKCFSKSYNGRSYNAAFNIMFSSNFRKSTISHCFRLKCNSYHHLAIIGTGPSAFYTAKYLLDKVRDVKIDFFDRTATPFGLVRFGVAPDHPEVKSVINTFNEVAGSSQVRFFGNVNVGQDIKIQDLYKLYSGVVMAHGASSDNDLNIPGENLKGCLSARQFVNWYNGDTQFANLNENNFDLSEVQSVAVVGQGNVAIDCARVLACEIKHIETTDIAAKSLAELKNSKVKHVHMIGRRGHVQAAFTIAELRELTRMSGVSVWIDRKELESGLTEASKKEIEESRAKKRIVELINTVAGGTNKDQPTDNRVIDLRFLLSPVEILPAENDSSHVGALKCAVNALQGEPKNQKAVPTGATVTIACQLILKSIGYKCVPLSSAVPFDTRSHTIPHSGGRVIVNRNATNLQEIKDSFDLATVKEENGSEATTVQRLYVAGWLKRGATGIIGSNIGDAKETVASVVADIQQGVLRSVENDLDPIGGYYEANKARIVTWGEWLKIDAEEVRRGSACCPPKLRDKITDAEELLRVAKGK